MLLGEEDNAGRAFEFHLVRGNAFYILALTPGAADQSLGAFQKKRWWCLPSSEFSDGGHKSP